MVMDCREAKMYSKYNVLNTHSKSIVMLLFLLILPWQNPDFFKCIIAI